MIAFRMLLLLPLTVVVSCLPNTNQAPPIHQKMYALVEKFDRFDDNGDGYLTQTELKTGVDAVGTMVLTGDQYARVMKVYDTNRDRRISLREAQIAAQKGPILFEE